MKKYRGAELLLGLIIAAFIVSAAVVITLNFRPLYVYNMKELQLDKAVGMTEEAILKQYDALISYNQIWGEKELVFPDLVSSDNGLTHFKEVKVIFMVFEWMAAASLIFAAAGIFFFRQKRRERDKEGQEKRYLLYAAALSIGLPAVIGVFIAISWERVFVVFHEIMFKNDYWIFSPETDPIINLLPDRYFMHCAILIAALVFAGGIGCLAGWGLTRKKNH